MISIRRVLLSSLLASAILPAHAAAAIPSNQFTYNGSTPAHAELDPAGKVISRLSTTNPSEIPAIQWSLTLAQLITLLLLLATASANQRSADATAATVREMQISREKASAPNIVVYLASPSSSTAEIIVENFGEGTAREVVFQISPPLCSTMFKNAGKFFESPKWLPPRSRLAFALDTWKGCLSDDCPPEYNVRINYKDAGNGNEYAGEFVLDMKSFHHLSVWSKKSLNDLVQSVEKLVGQQERQSRDISKLLELIELGSPYTRPHGSLEEAMASIKALHEFLQGSHNRQGIATRQKLVLNGLRAAFLDAITFLSTNHKLVPELKRALLEALLQLHDYRALNNMMEPEQCKALEDAISSSLAVFYASHASPDDQFGTDYNENGEQ